MNAMRISYSSLGRKMQNSRNRNRLRELVSGTELRGIGRATQARRSENGPTSSPCQITLVFGSLSGVRLEMHRAPAADHGAVGGAVVVDLARSFRPGGTYPT